MKKKPIAVFDFKYKKKDYRKKKNASLINEIIDFANNNKIKSLQLNKRGGMYMKTIFYYQHQKKNAYKLAYILWANNIKPIYKGILKSYFIGVLLGYDYKNINYFYLKNYNIEYIKEHYNFIKEELKNMENYKQWIEEMIKEKKISKIEQFENI